MAGRTCWNAVVHLLLAAFLLAQPSPLWAGDKLLSNPAEEFLMAPGGVDMRTGQYTYRNTDLSIGNGSTGLTLERSSPDYVGEHLNPFGNFSHNWDIRLVEKRVNIATGEDSGMDYRMFVQIGGRTLTFERPFHPSGSGYGYKGTGPAAYLTVNMSTDVFTLRTPEGALMTFRSLGSYDCGQGSIRCAYAAEIVQPDGARVAFDYAYNVALANHRARLQRVTHSAGFALLLEGSGALVTRACAFNLANATVPAVCPTSGNSVVSYSYSSQGQPRLTGFTDASGALWSWTYTGSGMGHMKPDATTPSFTNFIGMSRDEAGDMQEIVGAQTFADGSSFGYSYDRAPVTTNRPTPAIAGGRYQNALGQQVTLTFGYRILPGTEPGFCFQTLSCNVDSVEDFLNLTWQQTPGPIEIINPLNQMTKFDYCDPLPLVQLPSAYRERCFIVPLQSYTGPDLMRTELQYGDSNNITQARGKAKLGSPLADVIASATYFCNAPYEKSCTKPVTTTDPLGRVTTFTYAPEHGGALTETGPAVNGIKPQKRHEYAQRHAWVSNGNGGYVQAATPIWVKVRERSCKTTAAAGQSCQGGAADEVVTDYDYGPNAGPNNLLLRSTTTSDATLSATTSWTYDAAGNKLTEDGPDPGVADTKRWHYDIMRRVVGTVSPDPDGAGLLLHPAVRNSYDAAGRLVKVEQGTVAGITDGDWPGFVPQLVAETAYDLLDRKLREWSYGAGQPVTALAQYSYDLAGRLECTAMRMNAAAFASPPPSACTLGAEGSFGPDRIIKLTYDAAGQLIKTTLAFGTPLQVDDETNSYTVTGKLASVTDGEGNRTGYTYDGFDRLARTAFPSPTTDGVTSGTDYEDYGYDAGGNRISLRKRDNSILNYQYDALNRMTVKDVPDRAGLNPIHTRDVHYGYDLSGLQLYARFDSASGEGVTFAYDGLGRLITTTLTMDGVSRTLNAQYAIDGSRTQLTYPDGVSIGFGYDGLGRMTSLGRGATSGLASYSYNDRGQRSSLSGGGVTSYGYDPVGRLNALGHDITGTTSDVALTYGYNPAAQLIAQTTSNDLYVYSGEVNVSRSYAVNGLNQYLSAGSVAFTYDPNGNLTSDGATSYLYDVESRLVSASGARSASLRYDPLGRLYEVGGGSAGITRFLYDGDELVAEYGSAGTMLRRHVHGSGSDDPLATFEGAGTADAALRYLKANHQGSLIAQTTADGEIFSINRYDEWGVPWQYNAGRFQYTGQAWIPELGMYHYKARIYSPTLGRFMQTDPIGYDDGINWYAYVGNDPVNKVDTDGTCAGPLAAPCLRVAQCTASAPCREVVRSTVSTAAACARSAGCRATVTEAVVEGAKAVWDDLTKSPKEVVDAAGPLKAPAPSEMAGHRKKRPSTKGKHEEADARRGRDGGGEKGDGKRDPPRKRPPDQPKGPWPDPKDKERK